jgi:hypothetical protein
MQRSKYYQRCCQRCKRYTHFIRQRFQKNSTDGAITDSTGSFKILTKLLGSQVINVSYIGYQLVTYPITLENKEYSLSFVLKEAANMLNEIVISAGTIEANNERKVAILKPLDIVTIAGGGADIIKAIQTLPGVQHNGGDQTGLLVRGGDASGRTYYNPNNPVFLADRAPDYNNLSLSLSFLTTIKKMFTVIYVSVDNITNRHNILGYRYSYDGSERYPVIPSTYRTIFFGINLSLTKFNKDEL